MCPRTWQAKYELKADTVPQCVCDLLNDLEKIEKAFLMEREQPGKKGKAHPVSPASKRWSQFTFPSPRSLARMQNIVLFTKSMGTARDPQHLGLS